MSFSILKMAYLAVLVYHTFAVPIGRVIGCGKEDPNLSPETRRYCCESFSLDCEETKPMSTRTETVSTRSETMSNTGSHATRSSIYESLVPRRQLGPRCKEPAFSCGVGLECHMGVCRRVRTRAHLEELLERGKEVEKEEKMDGEDGQPASQRNEQEGELTFRGQSVTIDEVTPRGLQRSTEKLFSGGSDRREPSVFEEDEVAANVADLLAAKLAVSLNGSQVRSIRDVIAGTLDERAEREDQADSREPFDGDATGAEIRGRDVGEQGRNRSRCRAAILEI